MKKLIVLAIILFSISACNKDDVKNSEFIGKWKIHKVSGGLHGNGYVPYFKYLYFLDDNNCKWTDSEDSLITDGKYTLSSTSDEDFIQFDTDSDTLILNMYVSKLGYKFLSTDTLYMDHGCCDNYDYTFVKVN